jgi:hypothetical protein
MKILYGGAWATIVAAIFLISLVTVWLVRPYRGLYDVNAPFKVEPAVVQVGALLHYNVQYCVDEDLPLPISVSREMEMQSPEGYIFPIAPPIGYLIQERCESRELTIGVPAFVPSGVYHIHYTTALEVNPFRVIRQSFVSQEFEIVDAISGTVATKTEK